MQISLTPREIEILMCMTKGYTKAQVATELNIAESTVKSHAYRLYSKLGADNAIHALWIALEKGLLDPPERVT